MTVRICGAVMIAAVSLYVGGACSAQWQRRVELLSAFCRLLEALGDGIAVMGLPMQQIVLPFSDAVLERTGFLPKVRQLWEEDMCADALRQALGSGAVSRWLEEEDMALLGECFADRKSVV